MSVTIGGHTVPRLAFGMGSLMKWAPDHSHPLPTDSYKEITAALKAGFRLFNTGDLYSNNESAARAFRDSGLDRKELFLSLKLNTYSNLGGGTKESIVAAAKKWMEQYGLKGYIDIVQLHFPPRGKPGNLSNREAWRILEELKDEGVAKIIGLSNWSLEDYQDLYANNDLKHHPQLNEIEFNPHLLADPAVRERHLFEVKYGITNMFYGLLTPVTGRQGAESCPALCQELGVLAKETGLTEHELLLRWAFDSHGAQNIVVTSTSKEERAARLVQQLSGKAEPLADDVFGRIEAAAKKDGYEGKMFYKHPHMNK